MSAPITEAHLELAKTALFSRDNVGRLLTAPMAAQLIADSEARAVEPWRTQVEELRGALALGQENCDDVFDDLREERDQLRAEVERLKKQIKDDNRSYGCELRDPYGTIWEQATNDHARAELAEAILGELQELHGCSRELIVHWCAHAAQRSLGLDQTRAELAAEREKAERYRLATLKLDAELAKEREKVRVLREALDEAQSCGGITGSIFMQARAALAATEDTK
jgi:hypothetical protein